MNRRFYHIAVPKFFVRNHKSLPLILLTVFVLFTKSTFPQSGTTSISGTVFDQQKQIIVGATVKLSNIEKGLSRTATTNDNGAFSFPVIQPGVYRLEVEMRGFKKFITTDLRALVDTPVEVSVVLQAGDVRETVNVQSNTAEALINTQDATIGNPFNSYQVTQLPTEARDVINLLTLQPGVTRADMLMAAAATRPTSRSTALISIRLKRTVFSSPSCG